MLQVITNSWTELLQSRYSNSSEAVLCEEVQDATSDSERQDELEDDAFVGYMDHSDGAESHFEAYTTDASQEGDDERLGQDDVQDIPNCSASQLVWDDVDISEKSQQIIDGSKNSGYEVRVKEDVEEDGDSSNSSGQHSSSNVEARDKDDDELVSSRQSDDPDKSSEENAEESAAEDANSDEEVMIKVEKSPGSKKTKSSEEESEQDAEQTSEAPESGSDEATPQLEGSKPESSKLHLPNQGKQDMRMLPSASPKAKSGQRRGLVSLEHTNIVSLKDFLDWVHAMKNPIEVYERMQKYPVIFTEAFLRTKPVTTKFVSHPQYLLPGNAVVPRILVDMLMAAVQGTRDKCNPDDIIDVLSQSQGSSSAKSVSDMGMYVFTSSPDLPGFTEDYILNMNKFYCYRTKLLDLKDDLHWLSKSSWDKADEVALFANAVTEEAAANEVKESVNWLSLGTKFSFEAISLDFTFYDMIGNVYGKARFNDAVIFTSILHILTDHKITDGIVIHTVCEGQETDVSVPKRNYQDVLHVVIPVNLGGYHWTLISVDLYIDNIVVCFYDPMCDVMDLDRLEGVWDKKVHDMFKKWYRRDIGQELPSFTVERETKPKQRDGVSCGAYVLLMAHSHLTGDNSFRILRITQSYLNVVRLRVAFKLINGTEMVAVGSPEKVQAIEQEMDKSLK